MHIERNLAIPNTLALPSSARIGCVAQQPEDVAAAQRYARQAGLNFVPLGEGSNVIARQHVESFVCLMRTRGVDVLSETSADVTVCVAAGENWHAFVMYSLQQGWFGLENLALIPGSVGAAPVQNIGAYGVEVARFIERVEVLDEHGRQQTLGAADCNFSYRDSVFKQSPGMIILSVTLCLPKLANPVIDYPDLQAQLPSDTQAQKVGAEQVAQAVIAIRRQKLPWPSDYPNVGSFFKNPVVSVATASAIEEQLGDLKRYAVADPDLVKLSAAQLIDRAGWKHKASPHVACWQRQPLVLVNTGAASDDEILDFAAAIQADINSRYGVELELEPSVLS